MRLSPIQHNAKHDDHDGENGQREHDQHGANALPAARLCNALLDRVFKVLFFHAQIVPHSDRISTLARRFVSRNSLKALTGF